MWAAGGCSPEVAAMAKRPVTVNDVLDGHVTLDLECLDRIYLNGYVPNLQVGGQVVNFLTHRGFPIPSPALLEKNGLRFRREVERFAEANGIPWVRFGRGGDRKLEVMRPHLDRLARAGRTGWPRSGWRRSSSGCSPEPHTGRRTVAPPHFSYVKADRRVTAYYFYVVDEVFGPAFVKVCAYFPYPIKIWLNGHEGRCRAPWCSTRRGTPGRFSSPCWWTTSTSAGRRRCRSCSAGGCATTRPAATGPGCCAMATR
jgi:hypothetical protein